MNPAPKPRSRGPKSAKVLPQALLDAAQQVFARDGIEGASLRAIARQAGCDPALIYYHFENKEAIFTELLDRKFSVIAPALQKVASGTEPLRQKLAAVLHVLRHNTQNDAGFRALVRGQAIHGAEPVKVTLAGYLRRIQEILWGLLQQGVDSGELRRDLPVPLAAFFLVRTYMEILDLVPAMSEHFMGIPPAKALGAAEDAWLDFFWRGAAANPKELS